MLSIFRFFLVFFSASPALQVNTFRLLDFGTKILVAAKEKVIFCKNYPHTMVFFSFFGVFYFFHDHLFGIFVNVKYAFCYFVVICYLCTFY